MRKATYLIRLLIFMAVQWWAMALAQGQSDRAEAIELLRLSNLHDEAQAPAPEPVVTASDPIKIGPGSTQSFSETVSSSGCGVVTGYTVQKTGPTFITFTDKGVTQVIVGSQFTIKFDLSVSASAPPGVYNLSLTYNFVSGTTFRCSRELAYEIDTASDIAPTANFTGDPTSGARPLTVQFNDASTGQITSRSWDFGDGQTSPATSPSHTYVNAGAYTVSLTVTGPGGSNTKTQTNYITVTEPPPTPIADFTGSPTSGLKPLTVQFNDASTGEITSRSWDFGDGQSSTATNPSHTYVNAGAYTVSLTVTGPGGSNTKTQSNYITVNEPLAADFTGSPIAGMKPLTVQFTDISTGQITSRAWNFGDGQTSTVTNPSHTYVNDGTYTVSLTVSGPSGTNTKTRENYITIRQPSSLHVSTTGNDANAGTNQAPLRNISTALSRAAAGDTVKVAGGTYLELLSTSVQVVLLGGYDNTFTNSGRDIFKNQTIIKPFSSRILGDSWSSTIDGLVLDGGNGANTGIEVSSGHATITHNVFHRLSTSNNTAQAYGINVLPNANATIKNNSITNVFITSNGVNVFALYIGGFGTSVSVVENNIVYNNEAGITVVPSGVQANYNCVFNNRRWNYGALNGKAGANDIAADPQFLNTALADFRLRPTSPCINKGNPTDPVGDEPEPHGGRIDMGAYGGTQNATPLPPPPPVAEFAGSPTSGPRPLLVQFTGASTGEITGRLWNFGDGQTATATNPSHTYANAGTYTVSLTVTGPGGSNTRTRTNYITVQQVIITVPKPAAGEIWKVGEARLVEWTSTGVSGNVHLKLSTDGGATFPITLAANIANDGAETVTVPNNVSPSCRVRIESVANASVFGDNPGNFTIQASCSLSWQATLNVRDAGNNSAALQIGQGANATNGLDAACGEADLPPIPPTGIFDARFELPISPPQASLKDFRNDTAKALTWRLKFQPGVGAMSFAWNSAEFPAGSFFLKDEITGALINVNMKSQNSFALTTPGITSLKVEYSREVCLDVVAGSNWNIISIPLLAADMSLAGLFPDAASSAFGFNNGYVAAATLMNGKGYWIKFNSAKTYHVCGASANPREIAVNAGWNMIGPFDTEVQSSAITSTPAGIVESDYFGYNNGYVRAAVLTPGKGYWIKVSQAGTLRISGSALAKRAGLSTDIQEINPAWPKIIFVDRNGQVGSLYLAPAEENHGQFALPPVPPAGIFDVRFQTGEYVASLGRGQHEIQVRSALYPLRLSAGHLGNRVFRLKDMPGNETLTAGKKIVIATPMNRIVLEELGLPARYALEQNYPNPFSSAVTSSALGGGKPTTAIKFSLPEKANVKITLYDLMGRKVAELVNQELNAGYHQVEVDARRYAGGIYFYVMEAGGFRALKKMVVAK